jgi:hypothetical protein
MLFVINFTFNLFVQPKRDQTRKVGGHVLPPVIDLKSKKDDEDSIFGSLVGKVGSFIFLRIRINSWGYICNQINPSRK